MITIPIPDPSITFKLNGDESPWGYDNPVGNRAICLAVGDVFEVDYSSKYRVLRRVWSCNFDFLTIEIEQVTP